MMVGDIIAEPLLVSGVPAVEAPGAGARAARPGRPAGGGAHALPARFQRRPAPAHRHRPRAGARSDAGGRRRAGLGARRLGAGADHQPAARAAGPARPVDAVRRPRPRRGAPCQRPRGRDVCRPHRRGRADHRSLCATAPSLHRGAARRRAQGRSAAARPGRRAARRGRRSGQPAAGLRLPSALPACGRPLPDRDSGAARSRRPARSAPAIAPRSSRSPASPRRKDGGNHASHPDRRRRFAARGHGRRPAACRPVAIRSRRPAREPDHRHRHRAVAEEVPGSAGARRHGQGGQAAAGRPSACRASRWC